MKNLLENPLIRFILWCYLGFIVCFVGSSNVFALETKTIYSTWSNSTTLGGQNNYSYSSNNTQSLVYNGVLGTQYTGRLYDLNIKYYESISTSSTYTVQFNFNDYDVMPTVNSSNIIINTCTNENSCIQSTIISTKLTNYSGNNYKTITIQFIPNAIGSVVEVFISKSNYITGMTNWRLNNVKTESNQQQQTDIIINNATNNTQNIIDNSNTNTQDIIDNQNQNNQELKDTINDNFNTKIPCDNLLQNVSGSTTSNGITFTKNNDGSITVNGTNNGVGNSSYFFVDSSHRLTLESGRYNSTLMPSNISFTFYNGSNYVAFNNGSFTLTNTNEYQAIYLQIARNNTTTFNNVKIYPFISKTSTSYCQYGTVEEINKLDETNDKLGDLHNDLVNANVDSDTGFSFFNNFSDEDHGGLSGIVTAPLISINQMLNDQCSPLTATFKGKTISFACGYSFWDRLTGFSNFINLTLGGLLCYRILVKLFKLIDSLKNPDDDRVEVMNL